MKRYKLVKDTPAFKAGTECYIEEAGNMVPCRGISYTIVHKDQLEKNPNILTDWFEEVKEPTSWEPGLCCKYYVSDSSGAIYDVLRADRCISANSLEARDAPGISIYKHR